MRQSLPWLLADRRLGGPAMTKDGRLHSFIKGDTKEITSGKRYNRLSPAHCALHQMRKKCADGT